MNFAVQHWAFSFSYKFFILLSILLIPSSFSSFHFLFSLSYLVLARIEDGFIIGKYEDTAAKQLRG